MEGRRIESEALMKFTRHEFLEQGHGRTQRKGRSHEFCSAHKYAGEKARAWQVKPDY